MKQAIHPNYNTAAKVSCACGNAFEVGSTKEEIRVELCNKCHPFYTGKQKFVDTARRVEKFQDKMKKVEEASKGRISKKAKRAARAKKKSGDDDVATPKATPKAEEKPAEEVPAAKPEETPAPAPEQPQTETPAEETAK